MSINGHTYDSTGTESDGFDPSIFDALRGVAPVQPTRAVRTDVNHDIQLPPCDMESERAVLGCQLLGGAAVRQVREIIGPQDFHADVHKIIQFAILELADRNGGDIDYVLLVDHLKQTRRLDDIGGLPYLHELAEAVPYSDHAAHYAEIVREKSERRKFLSLAERLKAAANDPTESLESLLQFASNRTEELKAGSLRSPEFQLNPVSSRDFANADYRLKFLIRNVLVEAQPLLFGGPKKGMKTSTMLDMGISVGTGTNFLGHPGFSIDRAHNVLIISGESGMPTLQETAKRIAISKGVRLEDAQVFWEDTLPKIANPDHLKALGDAVAKVGAKLCLVDPAYLCLLSDDKQGRQASNMFDMGPLLADLSNVMRQAGCGIGLAHHTKKTLANPFSVPELEDLAYSGFAEFARQWILINRREKYSSDGHHKLWLSIGGSAGHSSVWAYDIEEGVPDEWFRGRRWTVKVSPAKDADDELKRSKEEQKESDRQSKMHVHVERIMDFLRVSDSPQTKTEIRDATGLNSTNFRSAFAEIASRKAVTMSRKKSSNGQSYDAYFLTSGHRDSSGQIARRPDVPMHEHTHQDRGLCNSPSPDVLL